MLTIFLRRSHRTISKTRGVMGKPSARCGIRAEVPSSGNPENMVAECTKRQDPQAHPSRGLHVSLNLCSTHLCREPRTGMYTVITALHHLLSASVCLHTTEGMKQKALLKNQPRYRTSAKTTEQRPSHKTGSIGTHEGPHNWFVNDEMGLTKNSLGALCFIRITFVIIDEVHLRIL